MKTQTLRNWCRHRLIAVLLLMHPCVVLAEYTYTTNNGSINITRYTGTGGDVAIPSTIDGLPVTSIGNSAFFWCSNVISVTAPEAVIAIGGSAFQNCENLASVSIPGNLSTIGQQAFQNCYRLTNVVIGSGTTNISAQMFAYCYNLGNAPIPPSAISIGARAFMACRKIKSAIIPDSVIALGEGGFSNCVGLSHVVIGTGVKSIPQQMFQNTGLRNIDLPPGVTSIGATAFASSGLTNLVIGESVTNIGTLAFGSCYSLVNAVIPRSVVSLGPNAFDQCGRLLNISVNPLNPSYSSLDGSLYDKDKATLIECPGGKVGAFIVPSTVTALGGHAFFQVYGLTGVYFQRNPPTLAGPSTFALSKAIVYYLPGATGWGTTYGGRPTAVWRPRIEPAARDYGVSGSGFGFNIAWASGMAVIVEACTNLADPDWSALTTNTLAEGPLHFSDPDWAGYPERVYRIRSP